jgi:stress response protein YsnF
MPTSIPSPLDPARASADVAESDPRAAVVPLVSETVHVDTEAHQVGAVRVRVEVDHLRQRVDVDRVTEEYQPTVRQVGTLAGERRDPYLDGDDVVIPVYEERMVVERRLFLKEEVRLRRVRHVDHQQSEVPLRRDRPVFERQQPDGTWRELPTGPGAPVAEHIPSPSSRPPLE